MRINIIAFGKAGLMLGKRLEGMLRTAGDEAEFSSGRQGGVSLAEWVESHFRSGTALVFIGAAGIAVRAIAPYLRSKASDPAVLVIDDQARFVISLLSGHIGGANALTHRIAALLDAQAVVTTATDGQGVFAVDSWAVSQNLHIRNPEAIKRISARLLDGGTVTLQSDLPLFGDLPKGVRFYPQSPNELAATPDIRISLHCGPDDDGAATLQLVPRSLSLGIGCRKDIDQRFIEELFEELMQKHRLCPEAIHDVASIDLKREEAGLLAFCRQHSFPFQTFSAEQLRQVPGSFSASSFVQSVTGVDNVCERSAVLASDGGELVVAKTSRQGVTMALARRALQLSFAP